MRSRGDAPRTCSSTWPSDGSAAGRRCRPSRPVSGGTSGRSSAAKRTAVAGPTICCCGPATPTRSTTPAAARRSASSCPMRSTSTARRWRPSTLCSASTRAAPRLPRRDRGRRPAQAPPPVRQGLVPGRSRLRHRPAPGSVAQHQAQPADPRDREHRLRDERQPADPASQGGVPAPRRPAAVEVRPPDPSGGAGRAAGRGVDDRHPIRLGRPAAGARLCPPRASAREGSGAERTDDGPIGRLLRLMWSVSRGRGIAVCPGSVAVRHQGM